MNPIVRSAALAFLSALAAACTEHGPVVPASVTLTIASTALEPGDTTRVTVVPTDARGQPVTGAPVTYSSSAPQVARVDTTGLVTAVSIGTATITATVRGVAGTLPVVISLSVNAVALTLPFTLDLTDTVRAVVRVTSRRGFTVTGRPVSYVSRNPGVAAVSESGNVRGVSLGVATIVATIEAKADSAQITITRRPASVAIGPATPRVAVGGTLQLTAAALDSAGSSMPGREFTWISADTNRVVVSASGLATWRAPGRTAVYARTGSVTGTTQVSAAGDVAVTGAHFTQGVQDAASSIPLIVDGNPAAVLVQLKAPVRIMTSMPITLRLLNSDGSQAFGATVEGASAIDTSASFVAAFVRFLLPATAIKPGLKWQVIRDADGLSPDDSAVTDTFPRGAPASLAVTQVPPLSIRFVPITLVSHGFTTPALGTGDLPGYLQTLRSALPVGVVNTTIGPAFATSASFGTAPSGGASAFWAQVLQELDLARIADTADRSAHWYGVVSPPAGFNFVSSGGIAYIPSNPAGTGAFTRTAMGVRTGWFNNPTQARDLVAHELSHNVGRRHAPCGNPPGLDPNFPTPTGTIGLTMHDVFTWDGGQWGPAIVIPSTGDVMSYCFPQWASTYTYNGVRAARTEVISAVVAGGPAQLTDVLAVQGTISDDGAATLLPLVALRGLPTAPGETGDHRLQGYDANGRLLFEQRFAPVEFDHVPGLRAFTIAFRADSATQRLAQVRLISPRASASLVDAGVPGIAPVASRGADGRVRVACGGLPARLVVQHAATGAVLGVSHTGSLSLSTAAATLSVSCSRGVRPDRTIVPVR